MAWSLSLKEIEVQDSYTLIGIDPGNNLGISIFFISSIDNSILAIETILYDLDNYASVYQNDNKSYKLLYLEKIITELINKYQPCSIAIEEPFINTKFPKAITSLSRLMSVIELTILRVNPFIQLYTYPPKLIKASVSTGEANKNDMKEAISNIQEVVLHIPQVDILSEHEIDATAIAYTRLKEHRANQFLLLTLP